jgi:hypothetical protein
MLPKEISSYKDEILKKKKSWLILNSVVHVESREDE